MNEKKKILIIEDDKDTVDIMKKKLESEGYDILFTLTGEEGLELATEKKPDLIILDIMLPKMNGFHVCNELRREKETYATPIIIVTAKDSPEDELTGLISGALSYIKKPFKMKELVEEVKKFLE